MSLLETIRNDSLKARKSGDRLAAKVLVTLLSEAEMVGKTAGNRASTDDEVVLVVRRFLKNIGETLKSEKTLDPARVGDLKTEQELVSAYVPFVEPVDYLPEDELRTEIKAIGEGLTLKDTKRVLEALNAKFPGRIDGKAVSGILKTGA